MYIHYMSIGMYHIIRKQGVEGEFGADFLERKAMRSPHSLDGPHHTCSCSPERLEQTVSDLGCRSAAPLPLDFKEVCPILNKDKQIYIYICITY